MGQIIKADLNDYFINLFFYLVLPTFLMRVLYSKYTQLLKSWYILLMKIHFYICDF